MDGSDQTLNIIIKAKDQASSTLEGFKGKIQSLQPTFQKMAAIGTAAFVGIAAVAKSSINAYAEVERANRQLEHAVIDVSKGTREQVDAIDSVAQALQKKAGVDADSLKMGAAQLSTFGLQSASVVKLTKSLADFTVNQNGLNASSDQYIQSANTIAKALNGQFGILEKSGIRFTKLQQDLILTGTETQKVAALQEGLAQNLRETTDTVDGLDVAQARMSRTMEDIKENLGKALTPAFEKLAQALQPIIEKLANWAEKNPELLAKIVMIAGAIAGLIAVVGTLGLILPTIITGFTLLMGPIGLVALAIGGIIFIVIKVVEIFNILKNDSDLIWEGIKLTVMEKINAVKDTITKVINAIKTVWMTVWTAISDFFKNIWSAIKSTAQSAMDSVKNFLQPIIDMVDRLISKLKSIGTSVGNTVSSAVNKVGEKLGFEHGGTVPGAIGTPVPILAHGGETILPAGTSNDGGANITINMNYPQFNSQNDVEVVRQQIDRALRDVVRIYKLQPTS